MSYVWAVFDDENYIDLAPISPNGWVANGHVVNTGNCWCAMRIEDAEDGRQIVIHEGREK